MKGVILAGGTGSRLLPLTLSTNKHLLPVANKPMIFYPIEKMVSAGITEICIVTGTDHMGAMVETLLDGSRFDCNITYKVQAAAGGIAQALGLAEHFVGNDSVCVILGDNMFEDDIIDARAKFEHIDSEAMILIKSVKDPQRYGVCQFEYSPSTKLIAIHEKPSPPPSSWAVTGIYFYKPSVFEVIKTLKPSIRNELEITDVNNHYLKTSDMESLQLNGWWSDAGTLTSYQKANQLMRNYP